MSSSDSRYLLNTTATISAHSHIRSLCTFAKGTLLNEFDANRNAARDGEEPSGMISTMRFSVSRGARERADGGNEFSSDIRFLTVHTLMHPDGWAWIATSEEAEPNMDPENQEWKLITRDPNPKYFIENWDDKVSINLSKLYDELHPYDLLKNAKPTLSPADIQGHPLGFEKCDIKIDMEVEPSPNHFGKPAKPEVRMPSADQDNGHSGPRR